MTLMTRCGIAGQSAKYIRRKQRRILLTKLAQTHHLKSIAVGERICKTLIRHRKIRRKGTPCPMRQKQPDIFFRIGRMRLEFFYTAGCGQILNGVNPKPGLLKALDNRFKRLPQSLSSNFQSIRIF